jgi:hypothetical protein
MGRPSKEYQEFVTLTDRLLTVPKTVVAKRHEEHKAKSAANPYRRGPKKRRRKSTPPSDDRA